MKKLVFLHSNFALLLFFFALMSGCGSTNYYYKPNCVNAPALADKGDIHASINFVPNWNNLNAETEYGSSESKNNRGRVFSVQAAASPIKYLGIMASYTNFHYQPSRPGEQYAGIDNDRTNLFEIGVGTYKALKQKNGVRFFTDCYIGYGGANIKSDISARINKYFIQPGLGIRWAPLDVSFNLRMSALKFSRFNPLDKDDDYLKLNGLIDDYGRRVDSKTYLFAEPAFTVRGGYKFIKAQLQLTVSESVAKVLWGYHNSVLSIGMYVSWDDFLHRNDKRINKMKL